MAIEIKFYTFNKNPNSTKQPSGAGASFLCNLIEPTSLTAPNIALTVDVKPVAFNYAHIPAFSRYYFVNDWTYSGGRWVASLNVDTLASFKAYIGSSRQYVIRSAANFDTNIIDTFYPTKNEIQVSMATGTILGGGEGNPFKFNLSEGLYIVGIVNGDTSAVGCVSYYAFNNSQFRALCNKLMGTGGWMYEGIEEIGEELTKVIFNPFQYVASCIWLPVSNISGTTGTVEYGWWDLDIPATKIDGRTFSIDLAFDIPKHPQQERGNYLNGAPFTRHFLDWPCFGKIALDSNVLKDFDSIDANVSIDPVSGIGTLRIAPGLLPIYTQQTQIGVPIQIAQMASNYGGAVGNIASGIASALSFDVGGVFQSIGNAVEFAMPALSTMGKNGSISAFRFTPVLCTEFYTVVDDDVQHRGKPLCKDVVLNTVPGFTVCADAELEAPCTAQELDTIKNYLNGGFYYE